MKKSLTVIVLLVLALVAISSSTYVHTIVIRSTVREKLPVYNLEVGANEIYVYQLNDANTLRSVVLTFVDAITGNVLKNLRLSYDGFRKAGLVAVVKGITSSEDIYMMYDVA